MARARLLASLLWLTAVSTSNTQALRDRLIAAPSLYLPLSCGHTRTLTGHDPILTAGWYLLGGQPGPSSDGDGVSSAGLHMQENEALASNSKIQIVQRAALIQVAAGALPDTTGYQLCLC